MAAERENPQARNRILTNLPSADLARLNPNLVNVSLEQGATLYEPGDEVRQVYFPHAGMISLLAALKDGQGIEIATVGREGVAGTMQIFGSKLSPNRANIQVTGTASRIGIGHLSEAMEQSAPIRNAVIDYNESLLAQIQFTAACNALHPVEARLARWILQTADRIGSHDIPLTQEFISNMLGVQRTSVTLVASTLQAAGMIRYSRGHIKLLNRPALEDIACECYASIRDRINGVHAH